MRVERPNYIFGGSSKKKKKKRNKNSKRRIKNPFELNKRNQEIKIRKRIRGMGWEASEVRRKGKNECAKIGRRNAYVRKRGKKNARRVRGANLIFR